MLAPTDRRPSLCASEACAPSWTYWSINVRNPIALNSASRAPAVVIAHWDRRELDDAKMAATRRRAAAREPHAFMHNVRKTRQAKSISIPVDMAAT